MKAMWRGHVIAESEQTVEVHGYHYFPRDAVRMELLTPAPREGSDLECPHGVRFYDIADNGKARSSRAAKPPSTKQEARISRRAAWSYEKPRAAMKQVDHWIGFWEDVEIA